MVATRKLRFWLVLTILACAALYLVGNGRVPLWDRDEGWYAQCSKQMWETGDWVVPWFLDHLRTEKPIFVYWLQIGGYFLFGGPGDFAVRFYAAIAQTIVVAILGFSLFKMVGPLRGTLSALIYGSCVMSIIAAKMCLTDATLMVFVLTVQLCLMSLYMGGANWSAVVLMFICLGFGGLTKGPVTFVPTAFTLIALAIMDYERWLPLIRPTKANLNRASLILLVILGGLVISLAICAPWLIELNRREPRWIPAVFSKAHEHIAQPLDGHTGPPGYYLLLVWATFFPWSLLIPTAVYVAWKQRHVPQTRFAIAAVLGPWVFFEYMKTKLPHYPLVTYPFLAFLVADAIVRCARSQYLELFRARFVNSALVWALVIGALPSAVWLTALPFFHWDDPLPYASMFALSVMGYICTLGTYYFFRQLRPYMASAWLGTTFMLLIAIGYGWMLPEMTLLHTSSRIAEVLRKYDGTADAAAPGDVMIVQDPLPDRTLGYKEPTLAYYQGGSIRELPVDPSYFDTVPPGQWPRLMVITEDIWALLSPKAKDSLDVLGSVTGLLYSDEHRVATVRVVRAHQP
jgi:4-amino-4-deoxy-L-arabinose transferase-like glycosyltransferase